MDNEENEYIDLYSILGNGGYWNVNKKIASKIGIIATTILSDLISKKRYFEERGQLEKDGWFFNTVENITLDLYITNHEFKTCMTRLLESGFIQKKVKGIPAKTYYKIQERKIAKFLLYEEAIYGNKPTKKITSSAIINEQAKTLSTNKTLEDHQEIIIKNNNKEIKEVDIEISRNFNNDFNTFMNEYKRIYKDKTGQLDVSGFYEIEKLYTYCNEAVTEKIAISIYEVLERLFYTFNQHDFYKNNYTPQAKYLLSIAKNKKLLQVGEKPVSNNKTHKKGQEQKERMMEIVKQNIDAGYAGSDLTPEEEIELFG